jgi:hypothetical protein
VTCDRDSLCLRLESYGGEETVECHTSRSPRATMHLTTDITLEPGDTQTVDPALKGTGTDRPRSIEFTTAEAVYRLGLEANYAATYSSATKAGPMVLHNPSDRRVTLKKGMLVMHEATPEEEDTVLMAAVLESPTEDGTTTLRGVDDGGIEDLAKLGFSLDKAIDPSRRREDGTYEPLDEEDKRRLYEIALRWHLAWSRDAKVRLVGVTLGV